MTISQVRVDQAGFEAPFPQRSGAPMATVESGDISLTQLAHAQRYPAGFVGTDEQAHVIAHQNLGVDAQTVARGALAQQTEIVAPAFVIQKDGAPIDPALGEVERYPGNFQAGLARHVRGRGLVPQCLHAQLQMVPARRDGAGKCKSGLKAV